MKFIFNKLPWKFEQAVGLLILYCYSFFREVAFVNYFKLCTPVVMRRSPKTYRTFHTNTKFNKYINIEIFLSFVRRYCNKN
jgi:hypothetical protein